MTDILDIAREQVLERGGDELLCVFNVGDAPASWPLGGRLILAEVGGVTYGTLPPMSGFIAGPPA